MLFMVLLFHPVRKTRRLIHSSLIQFHCMHQQVKILVKIEHLFKSLMMPRQNKLILTFPGMSTSAYFLSKASTTPLCPPFTA